MLKPLILAGDAVGAALLVWLINWMELIPFRRAKDFHWTERARVLYPARVGAAASVWLLPISVALAQSLLSRAAMPHWLLAAVAAWFGALAGTYPFDHEVLPWLDGRAWFRHVVVSWLLRFPLVLVLVGVAVAMPEELGVLGWLLAALFPVIFLVWCWGGFVWVSRKLGVLVPADERLRRLVSETSARMSVPVRRVWLMRSPNSMAFALPYTGELLFTERLVHRYSDEAISAICAHEIGHLKESRLIVAARVLGNLAWLMPWMFCRPVMHGFGFAGVFVLALVSLAILPANRWWHRRLEKRADRIAHTNEGETGAYARALVRLYEDNLIPAVLPRRARLHPNLYDRLLAMDVQPDFERPKPARSSAPHVVVFCGLLGILIGLKLAQVFP